MTEIKFNPELEDEFNLLINFLNFNKIKYSTDSEIISINDEDIEEYNIDGKFPSLFR